MNSHQLQYQVCFTERVAYMVNEAAEQKNMAKWKGVSERQRRAEEVGKGINVNGDNGQENRA